MTVATRVQPNFTTQTATQYKTNIDGAFAVDGEVAGAYAPRESGGNMILQVDAGRMFVAGSLVTNVAQGVAFVAPVSFPRIDRVFIDAVTGAIGKVDGTPAASPVAPAYPAGKIPIAQVRIETTSTVITNAMITDERAFVPILPITFANLKIAKAIVSKTANQSILNNTITILSWDAETADTAVIHDNTTNNSRLTVPAGYTHALVYANIVWGANATGLRQIFISKNNILFQGGAIANLNAVPATHNTDQNIVTALVDVVGGDYFEVQVSQTSGVALNVETSTGTSFGIILLG